MSVEISSLKRLWPWAPPLSYMALIAIASSKPLYGIGFEGIPWRDKGVHFLEFGTLAILNAFAFARTLKSPTVVRIALSTIALTTTWGYLDELHQAFVPGRTSDALDVLADILGSIAGTAIFLVGAAVAKRTDRRGRA